MELTISGLSDLPEAATKLLQFAGTQKIFLFYGDMGAGKTTFIKSLCAILGVEETVSSPTFSIVNQYISDRAGTLYHFDFYRLKTESEALDLGYEEYFYSGNYCFIEWPEKIPNLWPEHYVRVDIQLAGDDGRLLKAELF